MDIAAGIPAEDSPENMQLIPFFGAQPAWYTVSSALAGTSSLESVYQQTKQISAAPSGGAAPTPVL